MDQQRLSKVLVEFARTLLTDFSIQEILDHLVDRVVQILPVTGAGVVLMAGDEELHFVAASDDKILRIEALQLELREGPCITSYKSGVRVLIGDLATDERYERFAPRAAAAGLAAVFTFPLRIEGQRLGALDLYSEVPLELGEPDLVAAQILADVVAVYLFNAQARSQARASSDQLRHRALHDPLTGLPNRDLVKDRLEQALTKSHRSSADVGVLFVDLDQFKLVNDTFGHHVGDQLLIAVADRLAAVLRPGDTLGRLAGDEFVVLCDGLTTPALADEIARRVVGALTAPFSIGTNEISIAASVGVATARDGPGASGGSHAVLRHADAAMYAAKRRGGNQHKTATALTRAHTDRLRGVERDLGRAIERSELHLDYQPIASATTTAWASVEALLRWTHATVGAIPPETIVACAERTGLTSALSEWVVRRACRDMHEWKEKADRPPPKVAVNVSARELMHPDHGQAVSHALKSTGVPAEALCIEITESVLVDDIRGALHALENLKQLGVSLALDDFGTGYSSLSYLKRFPVDVVKIDRSFVANLGDDPVDEAIVEAVVGLAQTLGLSVVAEGVENARQLDHVKALSCDQVQGYFLSPPLPAHAIASRRFTSVAPTKVR